MTMWTELYFDISICSVGVGRQEESLCYFVLPELVSGPGLTLGGRVVEVGAEDVD